MATQEKIATRLEELHGSGYEIKDGQPDIVGWNIVTQSGKKAGEVDDLLFDAETGKVRYIIADLDNNELDLDKDRRVLIPIGIAELYTKSSHRRRRLDPAISAYDPLEHGNLVFIPSITAQQLDSLPLYEKGRLSRHTEVAIRKTLEPIDRDEREEDEFYRHDHFNEDRFYDR